MERFTLFPAFFTGRIWRNMADLIIGLAIRVETPDECQIFFPFFFGNIVSCLFSVHTNQPVQMLNDIRFGYDAVMDDIGKQVGTFFGSEPLFLRNSVTAKLQRGFRREVIGEAAVSAFVHQHDAREQGFVLLHIAGIFIVTDVKTVAVQAAVDIQNSCLATGGFNMRIRAHHVVLVADAPDTAAVDIERISGWFELDR